ncbi:hypothetical protein GGR56DRAFT_373584 [Xylariaceae sp. FL0804]|nr:hypothetical protein GGR56DRAFT_373584 [Xylariaceae sp. FL0804]
MSHQRYPSIDPKEPHSVSLKVLRLSRPSLAHQHPLPAPSFPGGDTTGHHDAAAAAKAAAAQSRLMPASLAYGGGGGDGKDDADANADDDHHGTNPVPFLLAPVLALPPSFGSAYVGETFSCTLCANHDALPPPPPSSELPPDHHRGGAPSPRQQPQTPTTPTSAIMDSSRSGVAGAVAGAAGRKKKHVRDVRIEAEMKTPSANAPQRLSLRPSDDEIANAATARDAMAATGARDRYSTTTTTTTAAAATVRSTSSSSRSKEEEDRDRPGAGAGAGFDLEPGQTLQKVVDFALKEEGNHVLAVTVSYYEATETSGRVRTFRKLYQFICKGSLIVRTKVGGLPPSSSSSSLSSLLPPPPSSPRAAAPTSPSGSGGGGAEETERTMTRTKNIKGRHGHRQQPQPQPPRRRWVMEAQLENCSEDTMQLERVGLDLEPGLRYRDCNWEADGPGPARRPVLHPGEVEQCCFVVEEVEAEAGAGAGAGVAEEERVVFGVLGIRWRGEMGNRGFLSTGKLGTRAR